MQSESAFQGDWRGQSVYTEASQVNEDRHEVKH